MDTRVIQPFSSSDHNTVVFGLLNDKSCSDFKSVYNYSKADWTGMSESLQSFDWFSIFNSYSNGDELWSSFCHVLRSHCDIYIPSVTNTGNGDGPESIILQIFERCLPKKHQLGENIVNSKRCN